MASDLKISGVSGDGTGLLRPSQRKKLFKHHEAHLLNKQEGEEKPPVATGLALVNVSAPSAIWTKNEPS